MASQSPVTAHQPLKALYTVLYLTVSIIKLPWVLLYYIPKALRQNPRWSWKSAVVVALTKKYLQFTSHVEYREAISLESGKEGNRFTIMQPSDSGNYKGPAIDSEIQPGIVGGTWYPEPYNASDKGKKVVLHLHGGAYVIFSGREIFSGPEARAMSKHFDGAWVFCPDYRLANVPSGRFPAALQDAVTSYRYLTDTLEIPPSSIIISGDSAGGHLALNLLRYLAEYDVQNLPLAALLWSPWTNLRDPAVTKLSRNVNVDLLDHTILEWGSRVFNGERGDLSEESERNAYISPYHAPFNAHLPICITYGTSESLCESIVDFIGAMREAGNKMSVFEVENAPHDPLKCVDLLEDAELTDAMFAHNWNFINNKA
jgi:acetyl esterase/lipase